MMIFFLSKYIYNWVKEKFMKKHTLYWYYKVKICRIENRISYVRESYAQRSAMSSKNFEFDHLVEEEIQPYKEKIFKIKRKLVNLR